MHLRYCFRVMKKRLTILLAALVLIATGLISAGQISFVSATACVTQSSVSDSGGVSYTVLQFKTVGTCQWTIPAGVNQINYLIVAGGGGGGSRHGGGGGAGGVVNNLGSTPLSVTPGSSGAVTVGAGGAGAAESGSSIAARGGNSSIFFVTTSAIGGGAGSSQTSFNNLQNGGSGGGARGNTSVAGGGKEDNQGNTGGAGGGQNSTVKMLGGGGGGFSSAGSNGGDSTGNGGAGFNASVFLGTQVGASGWFAGGGGGGAENDRGTGGQGGGGNGGFVSSGTNAATPGQENTGGGGGGGGHTGSGSNFPGKAGGSGIVIVRYITPPTITDTNGIVMLVDPRSESVPIPYLTVTSGAPSRICFDLSTESNSAIALKSFVDKNTDSDAFRMAVTSSDVVVSVGGGNALNKITASRANAPALFKRSVPNSESYLRLYRPDSGWSEVDGGTVKVRVDYAVDSDCSGVSGTEINVEIPIKVIEIGAIQKNPVDLSRG